MAGRANPLVANIMFDSLIHFLHENIPKLLFLVVWILYLVAIKSKDWT